MAPAIEAGAAGINEWRLPKAEIPFGGINLIGIGAGGGEQGLRESLKTQIISMPQPIFAS